MVPRRTTLNAPQCSPSGVNDPSLNERSNVVGNTSFNNVFRQSVQDALGKEIVDGESDS